MAEFDAEAVAALHVRLTRAKGKAAAHAKKIEADFDEQLDRLEGLMLKFLNDTKQDQSKTASGTFTKKEEIKSSAENWDAVYEFVRENDAFEALHKRISSTFVSKYMETHAGSPPPGVKVYREFKIKVTPPKE